MFDIFICCPAYVKTGGPELLHQLSDYLLIHHPKINTYFYYYDKKELQDYTNDDFKKYKIKLVNEIPDSNNSLIIVPETNVLFLDRFRLAKKVIWWQSVDNFLLNSLSADCKSLNSIPFSSYLNVSFPFASGFSNLDKTALYSGS